jgi:hypothetical protein
VHTLKKTSCIGAQKLSLAACPRAWPSSPRRKSYPPSTQAPPHHTSRAGSTSPTRLTPGQPCQQCRPQECSAAGACPACGEGHAGSSHRVTIPTSAPAATLHRRLQIGPLAACPQTAQQSRRHGRAGCWAGSIRTSQAWHQRCRAPRLHYCLQQRLPQPCHRWALHRWQLGWQPRQRASEPVAGLASWRCCSCCCCCWTSCSKAWRAAARLASHARHAPAASARSASSALELLLLTLHAR